MTFSYRAHEQVVEKVFLYRLFKNIQMQGAQNHEE
jgi:hypothetical protein